MSLAHPDGDHEAGTRRDRGDHPDGPGQADRVGGEASQERTDGVAEVTPEAIDADRRGAPARVGDVADGGEEGRVDHGGADTEQRLGDGKAGERMRHRHAGDRGRLEPHAAGDEPLAADAIGPGAGDQLDHAPDRRIDGRQSGDLGDVEPREGEDQRKEAPRHAVVQVVDQARLAHARQIAIADARAAEDLGRGDRWRRTGRGTFGAGVAVRLADQEERHAAAEHHVGDTEVERLRAEAPGMGDVAGGERRAGHGEVAGELVEPHRQAPPGRAREVDLHDDRGRPGEALADAEEPIRDQHPAPRGRPHEEEGHRCRDRPADEQDPLSADPIGEVSGQVVRRRLDDAEHDDERQDGRAGGEVEVLLGDGRQDAALLADHGADERVDQHQQRELTRVGAKAERDRRAGGRGDHRSRPWSKRSTASISAGLAGIAPASATH